MNKNIKIGIAVVIGALLLYGGYQIKLAQFPIRLEPTEDWEPTLAALDVEREQFFIEANDGVQLQADLLIPNGGAEKKGAVIFLPGSGDSHYYRYDNGLVYVYVNDIFLPRDIAILYVNKRGLGESEGNYTKNDFQGRADDVYTAMQILQNHPAIDADNIGVIGHSQGGWIASLVASEHDDVAFYISLAGPTTTVEEQIEDTRENQFRCEGYEGEELATKTERQMKLTRFAASFGEVVPFGMFGFDAGVNGYDPTEALRRVESPGLLVFGEEDILVPHEENIQRLDEIFEGDVPDRISTAVIAGGTHSFRVVDDGCIVFREPVETPFSEELVTVLNDWLDAQGY